MSARRVYWTLVGLSWAIFGVWLVFVATRDQQRELGRFIVDVVAAALAVLR